MKCPKCGIENDMDVKFCTSCGTDLSVDENQPETPRKTSPNAESFKTKAMPILKNKFVLLGVGALVLVIILISVISAVAKADNGYIEAERSLKVSTENYNEKDEKVVIFSNDKKLEETMPGYVAESSAYSFDLNTAAYIISYDRALYTLVGSKLKKVDTENVENFELSVTGGGLAYIKVDDDDESNDNNELYHYVIGKKPIKVSDNVSEYVISPDGKSVVYTIYDSDDDKTTTYFFNGKKSQKISSSKLSLQGMSNNGKYIYVTIKNDDGETFLHVLGKNGNITKLHNVDSTVTYYNKQNIVYFNYDHTQVLFHSDGATYISTNGKKAVKISSKRLDLVLTENSFVSYNTYPVKNLYDHIYTDGDSVWLIKKNVDKSAKLASKVSSLTLDSTASYLYYIHDSKELRMVKIKDGEKALDKARTIVDKDIDSYVVASDRSFVYYIHDNELHCVNGKNGKNDKSISRDDVDTYSLAISESDTVYYIMDGDLYACSNGKKSTKVLNDCDYAREIFGTIFAVSDNTLYATRTSKKLKKFMEVE